MMDMDPSKPITEKVEQKVYKNVQIMRYSVIDKEEITWKMVGHSLTEMKIQ